MILIAGSPLTNFDESKLTELERTIYQQKQSSSTVYRYDSLDELLFELSMRARIVEAARSLNKSGAQFASFTESRCNDAFWSLTAYGGFQLKDGVAPRDAINDIFANGSKYAFECGTATVIVLYKGILDSIDPNQFDKLFANLLLYDWQINSNLRLLERTNTEQAEAGDVLYFANPDFSPKTPWWRGENVILMEDGTYYGHGIGIKSGSEIIAVLNNNRVKDSNKSAYLTDRYLPLDFNYYRPYRTKAARHDQVRASIGGRTYCLSI